jgi:hypothetical protein
MFQKKYNDESDWIEISERITRRQLGERYKDVDVAIDDLKSGNIVGTPHVTWRWIDTATGDKLNSGGRSSGG